MSRCLSRGFLQSWNKKHGKCTLEHWPFLPHEGARLPPPWTPALGSPTQYSVVSLGIIAAMWQMCFDETWTKNHASRE
jgi:hypothetical protein